MRTTFLLVSLFTFACATNPQSPDGPRLYVFDCGSLTLETVAAFGITNEETDVRSMFVPCYLIDHQDQQLLWDGGLPLGLAGQLDVPLQLGGTMSYEVSLIDQMAQIGLTPDDIEFIAFSHFHFDHVGAANAFSNSNLLIQSTEYDAAFNRADEYEVYDATLYDKLSDAPRTILNGDHDVFGDGKVMIYSAPGHTPGHQVLFINLANTGPIMLSGDLYHFEVSRQLKRVPVFNTNPQQTLESMKRVEALVQSTGATLWIEHNAALAATLRKSPEFYD